MTSKRTIFLSAGTLGICLPPVSPWKNVDRLLAFIILNFRVPQCTKIVPWNTQLTDLMENWMICIVKSTICIIRWYGWRHPFGGVWWVPKWCVGFSNLWLGRSPSTDAYALIKLMKLYKLTGHQPLFPQRPVLKICCPTTNAMLKFVIGCCQWRDHWTNVHKSLKRLQINKT